MLPNTQTDKIPGSYQYGFHDDVKPVYSIPPGLSARVVQEISHIKNEPSWMLDRRLKALEAFGERPVPVWGANLLDIDFQSICYYLKPSERQVASWDKVPIKIKQTFDKLGIPQAEQKFLSGVGAQYDSEAIYHNLKEEWKKQGVIFMDMDSGLREHPEIVKQYFGTVVPLNDNKFAALNTATWSGGSFVYVPKGVQVTVPLQAYFRLNAQNMGQFERTLIIAEAGSLVTYVEGCTAPVYAVDSLHCAVVEIIAKPYSRVRYTTMQNWSNDVYNLVTKRAIAEEGACVEWVDGNFGSKVTMKYPSVYMKGRGSRADVLSLAYAGPGQHQDAGAKAMHLASDTSSNIISKSISRGGGRTSYRGLLHVAAHAINCKAKVKCDALLLDAESRSDTYPTNDVRNSSVQVEHEATVSKVGEEQLFYMRSRGLTENEATSLIVAGFIEPIARELPMEYAVELNRLIELEMDGSVG
ncbi:MAG: Iron-regulated ABC transporter membrane component SufB [Parcubacteria group bacterium GW2011_GWD2_43_10]|uniref:Fe-S cluster assembly protein SufB n=2 Tax=Candidatus Vebleniibacteriota TaxID=1817921 RepID=A0A1G2Q3K9_9BACT|nr:MAG: Iron-regulated ABC transporter membrane component SufB [Parcubacteria group bacterium GW2011_GWA2_42_80]KKS83990.1 MAG: Iron-regulated ABC transporter membrane component SufB [Parcubacteria group bacterium GW2011_GWD2_43_10]OHA55144.1 MAG: Fe-S cluster assembly protein SufB [Candidatus Veblenbacteria bacterium RIFOXYA2_FULL_43_9]OHA56188.1 MAG: Fe-S cluster assembly protein SufB [Candidatus Veblenbacteria bacterium RIFOXYC2_FULL_42_11]HBH17055.1 Fe-S cluster assembly protein SufB [Candi